MGKVLYLSVLDLNENSISYSGVMKKIMLHIEALNSFGKETDYVFTKDNCMYFKSGSNVVKIGKYNKISYFYFNKIFENLSRFIKKKQLFYDYIYIRHYAFNPFGYMALKILKQYSQRIYLEIPTYFEPERSLKNFVKYYYNKKLNKLVDVIVTDCDKKEIFGIKTLQIVNGTDLSKISVRKPTNSQDINVMLVAFIQNYHGIDKLIEKVKLFYEHNKRPCLVFHIVGYGPCLEEYKRLVKEYCLEQNIKFYGRLTGEALEEVYKKCELGISSLSNKEIGVTFASTLKSKEYLARGIPVISDVMLDIFYNNPKYYFWECGSDFSVEQLLEFYNDVYSNRNKGEIIKEIRSFANETCDMFKEFRKVEIDFQGVNKYEQN